MMSHFSKLVEGDRQRYGGGSFMDHSFRFVWVLRKCQTSKNPFWRLIRGRMRRKYGLEISNGANIAPGFYLGHAFNITVNPAAVIGKNVNLHKGVTIGQENRGKRKGAPIIGNSVWIGANATIVGAITIGDDVMIAPNAFVNCDVPGHSIVLGNPCRIVSREDATQGYVNRKVV